MSPQFRCPKCKRQLAPSPAEKQDAVGLGVGMLEPVFYVVAVIAVACGYVLDWWALTAVALVVGGIVGVVVYRLYLRRVERYYCSSCDKLFRADFLRGRAIAAQATRIAS